jgi:hypothetical protein
MPQFFVFNERKNILIVPSKKMENVKY